MSGRCSCRGAAHSTWHVDALGTLCAPQIARRRPQLPFLCPPFSNRRYSGESTKDGDELKTSKREYNARVRRVVQPRGNIDVSSSAAVTDMKDLMKTLKAFAEDSSQATLPEPPNMERKTKISKHRPFPPESPIFHFLENTKRKRRLRERKVQAPGPNMLAYDPWASMLAEPLRMCPATGLRLPKALLTQWGLVRNPEKVDDVYLLPTELADMEQLETLGARALKQRRDATGTDSSPPAQEDDDTSTLDDGVRSENTTVNQSVQSAEDHLNPAPLPEVQDQPIPIPAAIRMLPHLSLLKQVTLHVTSLDPESGEFQTKYNSVSRLLPTLLKLRLAEFNHYLKQRRQVEKRTGVTSRKPMPQGLNMSLLNWQTSVTGRVLGLMRQRVVVAVKRILELEADKLQRRRVQVVSEDFLRGEEKDAPSTPLADLGSAPIHDPSKQAVDSVVNDQTAMATPPMLTGEAKSRARQLQRSNFLKEIQTRVFLHFGPYPSPTLKDITTASSATPLNPVAATAYLPPMLRSQETAQLFPSFPLLPLLGADLHDELQAIVLQHVRVQQILTRGALDPDASSPPPCALMVKVTARHAKSLIREVWRLWRYVGGHEALELWAAGIDVASDAVVGDARATEVLKSTAAAEKMNVDVDVAGESGELAIPRPEADAKV